MGNRSKRPGPGPLARVPESWGDEPRISLPVSVVDWLREQVAARDGHHGENGYQCKSCGKVTVTVDVHPGVTPAFLDCRRTAGCSGMAVSSFYPSGPRPANLPEPAWEWFRPSSPVLARQTAAAREHVRKGGLLLRERTEAPATAYGGPNGG